MARKLRSSVKCVGRKGPVPLIPSAVVIVIISTMAASSGCLEGLRTGDDAPKSGNGEGPEYGVGLSYLDDTLSGGKWTVLISDDTDHGVLLVNNTGNVSERIELSIEGGGGSRLEREGLTLEPGEMEAVIITYAGVGGGDLITVSAEVVDIEERVNCSAVLEMELDGEPGPVTYTGDKVMVEYRLTDIEGTELDSGTLPATAGERYVGPAQQLGYIEGFYMGLVGMRKPGPPLVGGAGETKRIRLPPEMGYGTDPDAHELGGMVLIFTLTITASTL